MGTAQRKLFLRGVPVFTYHSVARPPAGVRDPFLYVAPVQFERQLNLLRTAGFVAGGLTEATANDGNPGRKFVITFDDGYCNVLENAAPVLRQFGFRAIQFITVNFIGGRNEWMLHDGDVPERLMARREIQEWLSAGHEIGSHSLSHPQLAKAPLARARQEIADSKKRLEDMFSSPIRHFCYPYGSWNETVRELAAEAGYETACTTNFGVNTLATPRHAMRRIVPLSAAELVWKVSHRLKWRVRKTLLSRS